MATDISSTRGSNAGIRGLNVLLGVWLFISAFIWKHTPQQFTNTWLVGVICVGIALIALSVPAARYLNAALAIWLFISAFALPSLHRGTVWNNALVAIAMFIVALIPSAMVVAPRRRVV